MDLAHLRSFRAVADQGSMTGAAQALALTQPAISRHIAALERELGVQVVRRTPHGARLTRPGEVLLAHANAMLDHAATARRHLRAAAEGSTGELSIAAMPSANAWLVPRAIASFSRRHPGVELLLTETLADDATARARSGLVDLAVVALAPDGRDGGRDGLDAEHLVTDDLVLALSTEHPLASAEDLTMRDLRDEAWIEAVGPGHLRPATAACAAAGFEPRLSFRCDSYSTRMSLVATGVGIALLPRLGVCGPHEGVVLRRIATRLPAREIYTVWAREGYRSAASDAMRQALREALTELA